ncbi:hypothetical protein [Streptomyces sp. H51]|uniref:hypothetical protein n=1 Tax=Streptomyces sp. H51 TaxID=3111770 RepID=UPI002D76C1D9|nr:hypothetical protein [Streptomyces sp. H51]
MGSTKATLRVAVLAAAVVALAPSAYAQDGGVSVSPSSPAPGGDVALRVSGCASRTATAHSAAFVAQARLAGAGGTLAGETRVRSSIGPGTYDVEIACADADADVKGRITVAAASSGRPAGPASPVAPVPAGGGGTARLAVTDARPVGPGTVHEVTGLVLACAAAAAVAVLGTRRGRGRG